MADTDLKYMHEDLAQIKRDLVAIKQILYDEGDEWVRKALEETKETPDSKYISHEEVKRRILK